MPKKFEGGGGSLHIYFFLNYVLRKTRRTSGELTRRNLSIFLLKIISMDVIKL
jgi:hypothetical protein